MKNELYKILNESEQNNNPYNEEEDISMPKTSHKRKKVLRLCDVNYLKKVRNKKREEKAMDSVFIPVLYGPNMNPEGGDMGGLGGMPM